MFEFDAEYEREQICMTKQEVREHIRKSRASQISLSRTSSWASAASSLSGLSFSTVGSVHSRLASSTSSYNSLFTVLDNIAAEQDV